MSFVDNQFIPEDRVRVLIMKTGQMLMGRTMFSLQSNGPTSQLIVIRDPVWIVTVGQVTNKKHRDVILEEYVFRPFFNDLDDGETVIVPDMLLATTVPGKPLLQRYHEYLDQRRSVLAFYRENFEKITQEEDREYIEQFLSSLQIDPTPQPIHEETEDTE